MTKSSMHPQQKRLLILTCLVSLSPILLGLLFAPSLPDSMAIHWGINGEPDNYAPKALVLYGIPVLMAALQAVCCVMSDKNIKGSTVPKAVKIYEWIIPVLSVVLYCITIAFSLGADLDIRKLVCFIVGVIFIVTGNYAPKSAASYKNSTVRRLYTHHPNLYRRYLRVTGYTLVLLGAAMMVSIFMSAEWSASFLIGGLGVMIIQQIYYYQAAKYDNKQDGGPQDES